MSESKRIKKIGIVWANPYNKNLGVGALAYSALALLNDIVRENKINAEFTFFGSSIRTPDQIKINDQTIQFSNMFGMDFSVMKSKIKLLFFPRRFNAKKMIEFDYVFDIAEGDSFTDIYGDRRFSMILNSKKYFAKLKKVQVLLPQTIGPFKDPVHEKEAFEAMAKLDMVISRDKQSYDYTAKFLSKDKIAETIDVAFYMPFTKNNINNGKINVGINVSGLLWNGGYTRNNQFGMKTDYKKLIKSTLDFFTSQENVRVHLVPHVIPANIPVEDDYAVSELLKKEYPEVVLSPRFESPIVAKSYISGLDFLTGARMHACIAAFSAGVPVFPMAYSRKFNGLFIHTLQYETMGDCVNESEEEVLKKLKKAFLQRNSLKQEIEIANQTIVYPRLDILKKILSEIITN